MSRTGRRKAKFKKRRESRRPEMSQTSFSIRAPSFSISKLMSRLLSSGDSDGSLGRLRLIAEHTVAIPLIVLSIWIVQWLLNHLLGKDETFFDWIPIRWVTDFADLVVIGAYLWSVVNFLRRKK